MGQGKRMGWIALGDEMRLSEGRVEFREVEGDRVLPVQGRTLVREGIRGEGAHDVGPKFIICGLLMILVTASAPGGQILPLAWPPWWI